MWALTFYLNKSNCMFSDVKLEVLSLRMVNPLTKRFSRRFKRRRAAILQSFQSHWPAVQISMVRSLGPTPHLRHS